MLNPIINILVIQIINNHFRKSNLQFYYKSINQFKFKKKDLVNQIIVFRS
jgi:hypothetical protein